jgi:uncharacterized protein (TIGR00255 family)
MHRLGAMGGMGLTSMTGFAASSGEVDGIDWRWDLRTLNGRGLDMRVRVPPGFEHVEPAARERIARVVARGNCQAGLQIRRSTAGADLTINEAALARVMELVAAIRARGDIAAPRADGVLALKGVLDAPEPGQGGESRDVATGAMIAGLERALTDLGEARRREGDELARSLLAQLGEITALVDAIAALPTRTREAQLERLRGQLERLLETGIELSSERLQQEAALLATKVDIREEIDRVNAHVEAARGLIGADGAVGRRLDFLAQEFNREANTICAKSSDIETTRLGLELKAVIDQFREQVQNVE